MPKTPEDLFNARRRKDYDELVAFIGSMEGSYQADFKHLVCNKVQQLNRATFAWSDEQGKEWADKLGLLQSTKPPRPTENG